jgi:hypothetical protein
LQRAGNARTHVNHPTKIGGEYLWAKASHGRRRGSGIRRRRRLLEMNVYKPLMIFNVTHSITVMTDGCVNFRKFLIGAPNEIRRRSRNTLNARSCW